MTRTHAEVCVAVLVAVMAAEPLAGIRVAMARLQAATVTSSKAAGAKTRAATANSRSVDGVTRAAVTEPQPATARQPAVTALRTVGMADMAAVMARRKVAWEAAARCVAVPVVVAAWAEDAAVAVDEAEAVAHLTKACVGLTIKTSLEFLSQTFS